MARQFRFCSLSSSSVYGNCYFVEAQGGDRVLVDCGVPLRRLEAYLAELDVPPESISAIFITHEHKDHTAALDLRRPFAQRYGIPVCAPPGFWRRWGNATCLEPELRVTVAAGSTIDMRSCSVTAFRKPHDTIEPVGYTVSCGSASVSIVTDLGCVPPQVIDAVRESTHLVFESNHDRDMELNSGRADRLIQRVLSDVGHLSNDQSAHALAEIVSHRTRVVLLSHLSMDCNTPDIALRTVRSALSHRFQGEIEVAPACGLSRMFIA